MQPFRKSKFKELTDVFDKKYVEEIFHAAIDEGQINPNDIRQFVTYNYNGYHYSITRMRLDVMMKIMREQQQQAQQVVKKPSINDDPLGIGNDPWHKTRKYYKDKKVKPPDEI